MTLQEQMLAKLKETGLPHREINVYASRITVLVAARDTADKWVSLLRKFCRTVKVVETVDYCSEQAQQERSTIAPKTIRCFLVGATI